MGPTIADRVPDVTELPAHGVTENMSPQQLSSASWISLPLEIKQTILADVLDDVFGKEANPKDIDTTMKKLLIVSRNISSEIQYPLGRLHKSRAAERDEANDEHERLTHSNGCERCNHSLSKGECVTYERLQGAGGTMQYEEDRETFELLRARVDYEEQIHRDLQAADRRVLLAKKQLRPVQRLAWVAWKLERLLKRGNTSACTGRKKKRTNWVTMTL